MDLHVLNVSSCCLTETKIISPIRFGSSEFQCMSMIKLYTNTNTKSIFQYGRSQIGVDKLTLTACAKRSAHFARVLYTNEILV